MKLRHSLTVLLSTLVVFSSGAQAQEACRAIFSTEAVVAKKGRAAAKVKAPAEARAIEFKAPLEDALISKHLGELDISYAFWGQAPLEAATYAKALGLLRKDTGLSVETIQKAHKALTDGKALLKFRETSDAKVLGTYSFKDFSALTPAEVRNVEANPFLTFVPSKEVTKHGILNKELQVGDILFPSVETVAKFKDKLSKTTLDAVKQAKSESSIAEANQAILADLLTWSVKEAEAQVKADKEPAHVILAMLEWRVKSLGLYYESTYVTKGSYMEVALAKINQNRSLELSEAVVDVFAEQNGLGNKTIERAYRPKMTETFGEWTSYMKDAVDHKAVSKIEKLTKELEVLARQMKDSDAQVFETYYLTRLMTGEKSTATAESIAADFKGYLKTHYNKEIPEEVRALLIPIDFIKKFNEAPASFKEYYEKYYSTKNTLFRGVSNSNQLTDKSVVTYFKDFKGRFASEVSRSVFQKRVEFAKLAMLRFNIDLINGVAVEVAAQHAAKHMGYTAPNSAKTYFVSATDLSTIAFRFAMDKGYVDRSSSNAVGNTHMAFEFLSPKHGMVEFGNFKLTAPTWKNYFPRQRETSIAAGLDPNSLIRVYVLAPYAAGEKIPANGPEKHGKIVKIFERDFNSPDRVNMKLLNEKGEWVTQETFELPVLKD